MRGHLRDIQAQFLKGDFSGPTHIHGAEMAGLVDLKAAKRGQTAIEYKGVVGGAELSYRTADVALASALHRWFDAQVSDHWPHAMTGHMQHDHRSMHKQ